MSRAKFLQMNPLLREWHSDASPKNGWALYFAGPEETLLQKYVQNQNTTVSNNALQITKKSSPQNFKLVKTAALAAMMSGSRVVASGFRPVTNWCNNEDVDYIGLGDIPC